MRKTKSDDPVKITSELIKNPQRMMYGIISELPQNNLNFRRMATGHRRVRKCKEFAPIRGMEALIFRTTKVSTPQI